MIFLRRVVGKKKSRLLCCVVSPPTNVGGVGTLHIISLTCRERARMVSAVPDAARSDLSTAIFAKMLTRACKAAWVTYKRNALRSKGLAPKKFSCAKLMQG